MRFMSGLAQLTFGQATRQQAWDALADGFAMLNQIDRVVYPNGTKVMRAGIGVYELWKSFLVETRQQAQQYESYLRGSVVPANLYNNVVDWKLRISGPLENAYKEAVLESQGKWGAYNESLMPKPAASPTLVVAPDAQKQASMWTAESGELMQLTPYTPSGARADLPVGDEPLAAVTQSIESFFKSLVASKPPAAAGVPTLTPSTYAGAALPGPVPTATKLEPSTYVDEVARSSNPVKEIVTPGPGRESASFDWWQLLKLVDVTAKTYSDVEKQRMAGEIAGLQARGLMPQVPPRVQEQVKEEAKREVEQQTGAKLGLSTSSLAWIAGGVLGVSLLVLLLSGRRRESATTKTVVLLPPSMQKALPAPR